MHLENAQNLLDVLLEIHGPVQEILLAVPSEEYVQENRVLPPPLPITSLLSLCGLRLWLAEDASAPPATDHKREPAR